MFALFIANALNISTGLLWNHEQTYKNAVTNELFLMTSLMLFNLTGDTYYSNWAVKEWAWFENSGLGSIIVFSVIEIL